MTDQSAPNPDPDWDISPLSKEDAATIKGYYSDLAPLDVLPPVTSPDGLTDEGRESILRSYMWGEAAVVSAHERYLAESGGAPDDGVEGRPS